MLNCSRAHWQETFFFKVWYHLSRLERHATRGHKVSIQSNVLLILYYISLFNLYCDRLLSDTLFFLSYKIESVQKRAMVLLPLMNYNEALNTLNLTTLCERRAHLCQVYIDRLRNKSHPLHLMLPKWEEYI